MGVTGFGGSEEGEDGSRVKNRRGVAEEEEEERRDDLH